MFICNGISAQSRECYLEYNQGETGGEGNAVVSDHPVRRGVLRDVEEMERLMDNVFNFELAYAGAHTPVSIFLEFVKGWRDVACVCMWLTINRLKGRSKRAQFISEVLNYDWKLGKNPNTFM